MKYCAICGAENNDKAKFCATCGSALETQSEDIFAVEPKDEQKTSLLYSNEPTVYDFCSYKGAVWMIVLGSIGIYVTIFIALEIILEAEYSTIDNTSVILLFLVGVPAVALLIAGIVLLSKKRGINNALKNRLVLQHCAVRCCCTNTVSYKGTDVKRHKKWPYGYIRCPYCHQVLGHSTDNILYIDGE